MHTVKDKIIQLYLLRYSKADTIQDHPISVEQWPWDIVMEVNRNWAQV